MCSGEFSPFSMTIGSLSVASCVTESAGISWLFMYLLILCIETWNLLNDRERFLHQVRELLSQSDEQDQAPYIEDEQVMKRQRFVIADLFSKEEEPRMRALLSTYFEIEDVLDISINVQKSVIKQRDRRQKYLTEASHVEIATETVR